MRPTLVWLASYKVLLVLSPTSGRRFSFNRYLGCRVEIWRGSAGPVSRSRSSNRTCSFPASGFRARLGSFRPRQVDASAFQSDETELLVKVLIPKAISFCCPDLMLVT